MKLLHFADLHLGVESYGALNPRTGLSTRVDDFLRTFDQVIDRAIAEQVDAVLFAGDAFKNRDPNPTLQREFAARIRRLAHAEIPTVLLIGNHDLPSIVARATAIDIYEALAIPGIYVARRTGLQTIPTRSGPLQLVTLPWISRSQLLTRDELRELSADELQRRTAEEIAAALKELSDNLDPALPAVLMAHISVEGAKLGSEQSIMLGHELVLDRQELSASAFNYVALGHIHRHQTIGTNPPIVYAGSLERIDFGEEKEPKGYILVELEPGEEGRWKAAWQFQPLDARAFLTLRVKATNEDPMIDVQAKIDQMAAEIDGAIVRMSIEVPGEREELVRLDDVRKALLAAGAAWVARVVREADQQNRTRVDIRDEEALDPAKMLELWLTMRELSDEQRKNVLDAGLGLIRTTRESGERSTS